VAPTERSVGQDDPLQGRALTRFFSSFAKAFGFVPASVVADLQDIGNWKVSTDRDSLVLGLQRRPNGCRAERVDASPPPARALGRSQAACLLWQVAFMLHTCRSFLHVQQLTSRSGPSRQARATAIDALHKALKDVSRPQALAPSLPDFVRFLSGLVADPNFKISMSAMAILGELASKVGGEVDPHLK
jgi:hypothetical protein